MGTALTPAQVDARAALEDYQAKAAKVLEDHFLHGPGQELLADLLKEMGAVIFEHGGDAPVVVIPPGVVEADES